MQHTAASSIKCIIFKYGTGGNIYHINTTAAFVTQAVRDHTICHLPAVKLMGYCAFTNNANATNLNVAA